MLDIQTRSQSPSQSQDEVIQLREHLERVLQERKANREEIEKLRRLAEEQQDRIRELSRRTA